jgi:hypothetical protein
VKKFYVLAALLAAASCPRSAAADGDKAKPKSPATIELRLEIALVGDAIRISPEGNVVVTPPRNDSPEELLARFQVVDRACIEREQDIRNKRMELKNLATDVGTVDAETMHQRMQAAYSQLTILATSAAQLQARSAELRSELTADEDLLKAVDKMQIPALELEPLIRADPVAGPLARRVAGLKFDLEHSKREVKPGTRNPLIEQLTRELKAAQEQYDRKLDELKEEARDKKRSTIEQDIIRYESLLASSQKTRNEIAEQIKQKTEEAGRLGRSTVDSEMLRAEIKDLEAVLTKLVEQREGLRVALGVEDALRSLGAKGHQAKARAENSDDVSAKLDRILERLDRLENEVKAIKADKGK